MEMEVYDAHAEPCGHTEADTQNEKEWVLATCQCARGYAHPREQTPPWNEVLRASYS